MGGFSCHSVVGAVLFLLYVARLANAYVPSTESCVDVRQDCFRLKEYKWCTKKPEIMKSMCAKTCHLCSHNKCKDLRSDCDTFLRNGWCKRRETVMRRACPATCNLCPNHPPTTVVQATKPATKPQQSEVKTPITKRKSTAPCVDRMQSCSYMKKAGWCTKKTEYMTRECKLSCGFCTKGCEDLRNDCFKLSRFGWCSTRKSTMNGVCAKTCKFCGAKPKAVIVKKKPLPTKKKTLSKPKAKPKVAKCEDRRSDCPKLAGIGMCKSRKPGMKKLCGATCGFCKSSERKKIAHGKGSVGCRDTYGKTRCKYYKYLGWCEKHKSNMNRFCHDTCVCSNQQLTTTQCGDSEHGCCWDNKTTKDTSGGSCPRCEDDPRFGVICDRFGGDCNGAGGLAKSLHKYCPKTCDLC